MTDDDIFPDEGGQISARKQEEDNNDLKATSTIEFQKKIKEHQNTEITMEIQDRLNKPLVKNVKPEYKDYLQFILKLIQDKEIDVFVPSTLLHQEKYDVLNDKAKAEIDMTLVNLAQMIQQLQKLFDLNQEESYQLESLVDNIWYTKERIESVHGDVYKV
jgi:hypothetical protein